MSNPAHISQVLFANCWGWIGFLVTLAEDWHFSSWLWPEIVFIKHMQCIYIKMYRYILFYIWYFGTGNPCPWVYYILYAIYIKWIVESSNWIPVYKQLLPFGYWRPNPVELMLQLFGPSQTPCSDIPTAEATACLPIKFIA